MNEEEKQKIVIEPKDYIDTLIQEVYKNIETRKQMSDAQIMGLRDSIKGVYGYYNGINAKLDAILNEMKYYRPIVKQLADLYTTLFMKAEEKEQEKQSKEEKGKLGFKKDSGEHKVNKKGSKK